MNLHGRLSPQCGPPQIQLWKIQSRIDVDVREVTHSLIPPSFSMSDSSFARVDTVALQAWKAQHHGGYIASYLGGLQHLRVCSLLFSGNWWKGESWCLPATLEPGKEKKRWKGLIEIEMNNFGSSRDFQLHVRAGRLEFPWKCAIQWTHRRGKR